MDLIALGVPAWPAVQPGFDLSPLPVMAAALIVGPLVFGIRLTWRSLAALAVGGTLIAWLADDIGMLPALAVGTLVLATVSAWSRRRLRRH